MQPEPLTRAKLREVAGISASYAFMIMNGDRTPGESLAIKIFRKTGHKLGPIEKLSDDQIDALEQIHQDRAA